MKQFLLTLLVQIIFAAASLAQQSIFSGKIVNEKNVPVAGAIIKVSRDGVEMTAQSDADGLFYTGLLPSGNYKMLVSAGKKSTKVTDVHLPDQTKTKSYFYLQIIKDEVKVTGNCQDPFMKARLAKIEKDNHNTVEDHMVPVRFQDTLANKKH